jgi:multidrug efflux pump subunit AcrA (membrane-fusion protein)
MGHYSKILRTGFILVVTLVAATSLLNSCGSRGKNKEVQKTYIVRKETISTPLYFSGTIKPYSMIPVISPVDGVVQDKNFQYGGNVKKGQRLVTIYSESLGNDFQQALTDFFSQLNDYNTRRKTFLSNEQLYKMDFISKDEYELSAQNEKQGYIALTVSKEKLAALFDKLGLKQQLKEIDFTNKEEVKKYLVEKHNTLDIVAPMSGIATASQQTDNSGDSVKPIDNGTQVKTGQTIVSIGNVQGFSVEIQVDETTISELSTGMPVTISGSAFPAITLEGEIVEIQTQAKRSDAGSTIFPVEIQVKKVTAEDRKEIYLGMTTQVTIEMKTPDVITIPLTTVYEKDSIPYVTLQDPKTHKLIERAIVVGSTVEDSVIVISGLKPGDALVYHN